ncbi:MAG: hypothetical protein K0R17_569 [Rariglobus sp.]|jgi:glycosyltransferase involved in cell wall biosynthesis|nr:hypothetical protein [Rariglobus sp.]
MTLHAPSGRIALVGDYLPRQCGIATFSHDVREALLGEFPEVDFPMIPVTDVAEGYAYPPEVRFEIIEQDIKSYQRAADFINFSDAEVVALQHEFGIYGGKAGSHVLTLMRELRIPVVSHLHTIMEEPEPPFRRVMEEIVRRSARLIVMTQRGRRILETVYGASPDRIDVIPHGIPDMPFVDPNFYKDQFGVEGRKVLLTFGLLTPFKGIEHMITALADVVRTVPDVVYIVLGATHPAVLRQEGERYRLKLERLVNELGLGRHVVFYNRFVGLKELKEFLGATDIYVTPYLMREQIASGTLSYAFGCGKAVVSTPYWHAEELLADGRGVLVPFADSAALARELTVLLQDEVRRSAMRKQAYLLGRKMIWSNVAHHFMSSYQKARMGTAEKRLVLKTLAEEPYRLPGLRFDHLRNLTDGTGLLHNATHCVPDFSQGYHTADNARALRFAMLLDETGDGGEVRALASTYASFLGHAFVPGTGRFHDRFSFQRQWPFDDSGSDEALGATVWALGTCVGRSGTLGWQRWAAQLFERALPALTRTAEPSTWALGLLGLQEYLRRLGGDRRAEQMRTDLAGRLMDRFRRHRQPDWRWFAPELGRHNASLSHALIAVGHGTGQTEMFDAGLESLGWLLSHQRTEAGHFRAMWGRETNTPAEFEQRPIEAGAAVSACLEAFAATRDSAWLEEARRAFEWFLGRNELGEALYDPVTGGCYDALHIDRLNLNQGTEATLAFLLALQEMRILEMALPTLAQPGETAA